MNLEPEVRTVDLRPPVDRKDTLGRGFGGRDMNQIVRLSGEEYDVQKLARNRRNSVCIRISELLYDCISHREGR